MQGADRAFTRPVSTCTARRPVLDEFMAALYLRVVGHILFGFCVRLESLNRQMESGMLMRIKIFVYAALIAIGATTALAQDKSPVARALDKFSETCQKAMVDPTAFIKEARAQGQESEIAVARVPNEPVYWVLDLGSPGEMYVLIGEIAEQTRVYCYMGLMNEPAAMNTEVTNEAFLAWSETQKGLERSGGPVDLQALMAGDESGAGQELEMTVQVFHYLVSGWSDADVVASTAIQAGMIEVDAEHLIPKPLQLDE